MAGKAIVAGVAGDVMGDRDSVPNPELRDVLSFLDDFSGDFVTENPGGLLDPIPLQDIAPADSAGHDSDQEFVGSDPGNGPFLDPDVVIGIIHRHAHGLLRIF
jgi:hypothetical protein